MFSPSNLVQSMVQQSFVSAPKPVELKAGQVFQGTVIRHYPENMALVQIGGMQVQAKLEARLEAGQKAWLQVQPNTEMVTLKVLDTPPANSGKEVMLDSLIRSLGLVETKEVRAIVQALVNANLPVTKDVVLAFQAAAQRLGAQEQTVQAFLLAMKRELPLTPDTIAGLKAFLSEKTLSQAVQTFLKQASLFLKDSSLSSGQASGFQPTGSFAAGSPATGQNAQASAPDVRQLVQQIREKLSGLPAPIFHAEDGELEDMPAKPLFVPGKAEDKGTLPDGRLRPAQGTEDSGADVDAQQVLRTANRQQTDQPVGGMGRLTEQMGAVRNGSDANTSPAGAGVIPNGGKAGSAQTGGQGGTATPAAEAPLTKASSPAQAQGGQPLEGKVAPPRVASGQANLGQSNFQRETDSSLSLIGGGNGQEQPVAKGQAQTRPVSSGAEGTAKPPDSQLPFSSLPRTSLGTAASSQNPILDWFRQLGMLHERELMTRSIASDFGDAASLKQMENVKSLLIQLTHSASAMLPHALREAAEHLLQQVTGQQLMMLSPNNQIFSQVVMQIPLRTANGEETAYVQIEAQKKGTGQLDAENCRLFFHLEMQQLGTTMIDVNIVNKIVNLHLYNDTPGIEKSVMAMRDGLAKQLQEAGYHLSAMRVEAIPKQKNKAADASGGGAASFMAPYKGVDLRI